MSTTAANLIGLSQGIDSLNPIEQGLLAQSMAQDGKLAALYTGVSALNTQ
jgi:hypothetical protein